VKVIDSCVDLINRLLLGNDGFAAQAYDRGHFHKALRFWRKASDGGDVSADFKIGELYDNGKGVPPNLVEAAWWYHRAAIGGHASAQLRLGQLLLHGAFCQTAARWLSKSGGAEAVGSAASVLYPKGFNLKADPQQAVEWLKAAAKSGKAEAGVTLGALYFEGALIERNYEEARRWYVWAAEFNNMHAQFGLGDIFFLSWSGHASRSGGRGGLVSKSRQPGPCQGGAGPGFDLSDRSGPGSGSWVGGGLDVQGGAIGRTASALHVGKNAHLR